MTISGALILKCSMFIAVIMKCFVGFAHHLHSGMGDL